MFRTAHSRSQRAFRPELECLEGRDVPATIVGVTQNNILDRFDSATPDQVTTIGPITGLALNESIVGLAFRPATTGLYAIGISFDDGTEQLYRVDPLTAAATAVGSRFSTGVSFTVPTAMTFDPVLDQVRVDLLQGDGAQSHFRLDPDTGDFIANDPNFSTEVAGIAQTNPFPGATSTALYGYDGFNNVLVLIDTTTGNATALGPSGISSFTDFDLTDLAIGPDNAAYLVVGEFNESAPPDFEFYSVDLTSGAATQIGGALDPVLAPTVITVAPAAQFSVSGFPSPVTAGTQGTATVTALDVYGQLVSGYQGTVALTSSDPAATVQSPHTLAGGTGTFTATLNTVGTQSLTATDTLLSLITGSQTGIVVQPRPVTTTTTITTTTPGGPRSVSEAFGPTGTILVLVSENGTLMQFDAFGMHILGGGARSANVTLGPGGEVLTVVFETGALVQFDAFGPHLLAASGVRSASAAFSPSGETLLVVGENGMLMKFDAAGSHMLGAGVKSASVAFGPTGEVLIVAMQNGDVVQFDAFGAHMLGNANVRYINVTFLPQQSEVLLVLLEDGSAYQFDEFGRRLVL